MPQKIILIVIFMFALQSFAQTPEKPPRCITNQTQHPEQFERWLKNKQQQASHKTTSTLYRLPVVVHIIHVGEPLGEGFNLPDAQIKNQIKLLNDDFRRKPDTRGYNDHPDGADSKIQFQLAQIAPDGSETDGITRINIWDVDTGGDTTQFPTFFQRLPYYGYWNPEEYLNIWVYPGEANMLLGMAQLPLSNLPGLDELPHNEGDGVMVTSAHFGETTVEGPYKFGRTLTHEMGHFLGLFHVWGNGGNSCAHDDYCDDTPPVSSSSGGCPTNRTACNGEQAMVENYMDYTDDICMNIFTKNQVERMRTVLENSPRRKNLSTSPGLGDITDLPDDEPLLIKAYPNPTTKHQLHLKFSSVPTLKNGELIIHDLLGKVIYQKSFSGIINEDLSIPLPYTITNTILLLSFKANGIDYREKILVY